MNYIMKLNLHGDVNESNTQTYYKETKKNCEINEFNDLTNKLANNIYSYEDRADYTYRSVILIIQKIKRLQTYM